MKTALKKLVKKVTSKRVINLNTYLIRSQTTGGVVARWKSQQQAMEMVDNAEAELVVSMMAIKNPFYKAPKLEVDETTEA